MRTYTAIAIFLLLNAPIALAKIYSVGMTEAQLDKILVKHEHIIMDPPILANLKPDSSHMPIVSIFLAVGFEKDYRLIEHHEPLIRDRIIKLMNTKTPSYLRTRRGQRLTMFQINQMLKQIMFEEEGEPLVTDVELIELIIE